MPRYEYEVKKCSKRVSKLEREAATSLVRVPVQIRSIESLFEMEMVHARAYLF